MTISGNQLLLFVHIGWFFTSRITGFKIDCLDKGVRVKIRNFRCKNPKPSKIFGYLHLKLLIPHLAADIGQVAGIYGNP